MQAFRGEILETLLPCRFTPERAWCPRFCRQRSSSRPPTFFLTPPPPARG